MTVLKDIFSESRHTTTTDEIVLPFRHGILHGRDLGYANKTVAAKCWASLFAIKDWAYAIKQGKKTPPPMETELSFIGSLKQLKRSLNDLSVIRTQNEERNKKIDAWKARQIIIGTDMPAIDISANYKDFTPEKEAIKFAEYWSKKNYGAIAKQIHHFSKEIINDKKEAGKIRKIFENKNLIDYQILSITDSSPAISEVILFIKINYEQKVYDKEINLRFIYEDNNGEILIFGEMGGNWKFIQNFFHSIEYIN